jgi:hypothetical protein
MAQVAVLDFAQPLQDKEFFMLVAVVVAQTLVVAVLQVDKAVLVVVVRVQLLLIQMAQMELQILVEVEAVRQLLQRLVLAAMVALES